MGFFDQCEPNRRFNAYTSVSFPRGPTTWHTIDWDRRKFISTSVPEPVDLSDEGEEVEERIIQALAACVDQLDPEVNRVEFSMEGHLLSASSDPKNESSRSPLYCPIELIPEELRHGLVSRADLLEVERLSKCVDLVSYRSRPGSRAVFKYQIQHDQALRTWHELNCWLRLSGHPNIVPLDSIVTDAEDVPGHGTVEVVVGFTSVFIAGMTMQDNASRLFSLKHLDQLLEVVDDLNLKFGIVHQDIAPRNLLIDPVTDTLQIFDFSCAGKLGWEGASQDNRLFNNPGNFQIDLMGVVATVYEIITRDTPIAEQILMGADISTVEEKDWIKHPDVILEADVSTYRTMTKRWLERRKQPKTLITHYTQAPNPIEWPQVWRPIIPPFDHEGNPVGESQPRSSVPRAAFRALGLKSIEWERPAHDMIPDGFCVLGDGRLVAEADLQSSSMGSPQDREDQLNCR